MPRKSDKKSGKVQLHVEIDVDLKRKFDSLGIKMSVWLPQIMEDEIYIQNEVRKQVRQQRRAIRLMGSQGVTESSDQSHPDHSKIQSSEQ